MCHYIDATISTYFSGYGKVLFFAQIFFIAVVIATLRLKVNLDCEVYICRCNKMKVAGKKLQNLRLIQAFVWRRLGKCGKCCRVKYPEIPNLQELELHRRSNLPRSTINSSKATRLQVISSIIVIL